MNYLRAKTVYHADSSRAISIEQRRMLCHGWQVFVDQQPFINYIDFEIAHTQTVVRELEFIRRSDYRRAALRFKVFAEQLEFFLRRHAFQIDYRDAWRAIRFAAEKFFITFEQNFEHQRTAFESAH